MRRANVAIGSIGIALLCSAGPARAAELPLAVESLEVSPAQVILAGSRQRMQLIVAARFGGSDYDLTHAVSYQSADQAVATVDSHGVVRPVAQGTTHVAIEYGLSRQTVDVTVGELADREVSYRYEVLPALTKAGCNSGKCHGSPNGKGGFALSLRAFDPPRDLSVLTRHAGGRRIDPLAPGDSLLLIKATARMSHGGGLRLAPGDPLAAMLADWIAQGAPAGEKGPPAEGLEIVPAGRRLEPAATSQQLRVMARFAGGSTRDVTHLAHLSVNLEETAEVSGQGLVTRLAAGEVTVAAGYGPLYATSQIIFLPPAEGFAWRDPPEQNQVDRLVFERLRELRIMPAALADDGTFLRRAYLDACGVLPEPSEVRDFLSDTSPDKRERLIDRLLERPEFADYWAMKWSDRLGCNQRFVGKTGALKYHAWIRHQIAANVPEDQLARTILTASGGNYGNPPASFYRLPRTAEDRAEHVAQVFLGVRIGCARCHNHPGEAWTQDDYYALAAFFNRIKYRDGPFYNHQYDKEETIITTRQGELNHGRTGKPVAPRPLGANAAGELREEEPARLDRRERLAAWMTAPDNPFFARAAVNRIWHQLFGRGIVEPVDDFRSSNPPSHPELLDWLAARFIEQGYDRKELIRTIMLSRTYQLASAPADGQADDERYFSHCRPRLLCAEQLLDAIGQATGEREKFAGFPAGLRAAELPDGEFNHRFLSTFGRPARALACACERDGDSNLGQALELVGGRVLDSKVRSAQGRIARLFSAGADDSALVEECFLAALSRFPTAEELAALTGQLSSSADRRAAAEDILWALVNHPEFLFQH